MKCLLSIKSYMKSIWAKVCEPKTQLGFGIIEVMIAASLLMIIAAGMTALLGNMQKEQRRQALISVFASKKQQIQNAILNDSSWSNTMNNNASMACLVNNTSCSATYVDSDASSIYKTSYTGIVLKDGTAGAGNFYDGTLTGASSGAGKGFTETGATCSTFTTAAGGNDGCPFAYRISWVAQSNQVNPKIVVYAKLIYNPTNKNFEGFFNATSSSTTINEKYDVKIERTAAAISKSFTVASVLAFTGGNTCATAGFGACAVGSWGTFSNLTEISDPFNLVTITGGNTIRIDVNGNYRCSMTSYAFATNDASTRIYRTSGAPTELLRAYSSANSLTWGFATLLIDGNIPVTSAATTIQMQHQCSTNPSTVPSCGLGYVSVPYPAYPSGSVNVNRAVINCTQIIEK